MHFHAVPTYRHRIEGSIRTIEDIKHHSAPEEKSLSDLMLSNFLARKAKKIGRLPESGSGSDLDYKSGRIPAAPGVYLIKEEEYYKIGHTSNFSTRISDLRCANAHPLEIVTFIETVNSAQAKRLERAMHSFFNLKRVRGEWFELNSDDIEFFKDYQQSTGQHQIEILDVETFSRVKKEMVIKSLIQATKTLNRRTMTVEDAMQNSLSLGLTFAGWRDVLHTLDREKVIYFSGNLIRIPQDLIG